MLGKTLSGRYQVTKCLGSGGFGRTYLAIDRQLPGDPLCVVKQLQPQNPNTFVLQTAKRFFDDEARVLYRLGNTHNQIPKLFAHFEENSEFYLVQEFIDGNDLSKEIPGQPLAENQVISLIKDILGVLAFIHQENVIHRDINPKNLIRRKNDRKIVLIDFGAVKEVVVQSTRSRRQTSLTIQIGTPGYMPSEQARGKPRFSSDVYAVGIIGVQALTGLAVQDLLEDPNTGEIVWQNKVQVSLEFAAVLNRMIRERFNERYQSAQEALQALENLLHNTTPPRTTPLLKNQSSVLPTIPIVPPHTSPDTQTIPTVSAAVKSPPTSTKVAGKVSHVGWSFATRLVLFSSFIGCLWLCLPFFIQVIIDKVLIQQSSSNLEIIGVILAVVVILAGIFEFVLASLTSNASRYQSASKTIISMFMNLPRIFLSLFAFSLYNPMLVVVVVVLSSMFNIFVYLFLLRWQSHGVISKRRTIQEYNLFLYLPLGLVIPMVFWYGCTFVLKNELSLGQLMAFTIIEVQFMISGLNIVTSTSQRKITP